MNGKVLLVEDEELVGTMIRMNLEGSGHQVTWVCTGREALQEVDQTRFDLILLDIALPDTDGIQLLGTLRQQGTGTPIMMVTARSDVPTKVQALELGADDYLPKPFDVAELLARVQAQIRRSRAEREIPSDQLLTIGGHRVNLESREAETNEGRVLLSEKEAAVLDVLARAPGKTLSRSDILEEAWGMEVSPTERTVDNFILRLRKLFEPEPDRPRHFITVRGAGYRFDP